MSQLLVNSTPTGRRGADHRRDIWRAIAVSALLVMAVLLVFSRALWHEFSNFDDGVFVTGEPHVSHGLSWAGIRWAFTNGPLGEWYPLAMLSHMLDCQLFGLHPGGHHLTSVVLHAATAVALFWALWRMTGCLGPSALVAALFALHPQHVESVAWIAERRDVLSGLFFALTLGAYAEYVKHPDSLARYLAVAGWFTLGLMSKSMVVTLPAVLLLLDYWPLGRWGAAQAPADERAPPADRFPWRVVVDKLPLVALALADAIITMRTHQMHAHPLTMPERLANAAVSYVAYLGQLFIPVGLSPYYAHPEAGRPVWQLAAAAALLLAITAGVMICRQAYPYWFVGWFWYLGMLVPVLGLTYVGTHARADRYTYLPQIGIYLAVVWSGLRLWQGWPARRWVLGVGAAIVLAALAGGTWRQVGFWHDSQSVWGRALACDPKNVTAHLFLGRALNATDEPAAAAQYRQALELGPGERNIYAWARADAEVMLGEMAERKGENDAAAADYRRAFAWDPDCVQAHMNLGRLLALAGKFDEAEAQFQESIAHSLDGAPAAYCNLATALSQRGRSAEAIACFRKALTADPNLGLAHINLAMLLAQRQETAEAISHLRQAIELDPDIVLSYHQLAELLRLQGKTSEAARYDEEGKQASRRFADGQTARGLESARQGKFAQAVAHFQAAIAAVPADAAAHCHLADTLAQQGDVEGAIAHYRQALEIEQDSAAARRGLEQLSGR